ncbi:MAG TPA: response regulator transcription factor [Terriglobales bacterium]|nr:response regulator transcription factor [Terriglobales bacterium]
MLSLLTMKLRVLLGDDHVLILDGLRAALQAQYEIVGIAKDGRALVRETERSKPDLVILDISMPLLNGFEAAKQIKKNLPQTKLIFLSQHLNPAYLKQALRLGASGYVLKSGATEELQQALTTVLRGKIYITPAFGEDVIARLWNREGELSEETEELSDRQREILQLIVEGRGNKEIADVIHVSVKTVEFHRARIMAKLGVRSVAELTKVALQRGLIPG